MIEQCNINRKLGGNLKLPECLQNMIKIFNQKPPLMAPDCTILPKFYRSQETKMALQRDLH